LLRWVCSFPLDKYSPNTNMCSKLSNLAVLYWDTSGSKRSAAPMPPDDSALGSALKESERDSSLSSTSNYNLNNDVSLGVRNRKLKGQVVWRPIKEHRTSGSSYASQTNSEFSGKSTESRFGTRRPTSWRELLLRGTAPGDWREILQAQHRTLYADIYRWSCFFYLIGAIYIFRRWRYAKAVTVPSVPFLYSHLTPFLFANQSFMAYQADVVNLGKKSWYHLADVMHATVGMVLTFLLGCHSVVGVLIAIIGAISAGCCLAVSKNKRAERDMEGFFLWHSIWHASSCIYVLSMCEFAMCHDSITVTNFQLFLAVPGIILVWLAVCWSRVRLNARLKKQVSFSLDEKTVVTYSQARKEENRRTQRWKKYQRMLKHH